MSLKKSDKIIALIGVLIIVVAGIAIVYFAINQKKSEPTGQTTTTYNVVWTQDNGEMKLPDLNVEKGTPFTKTFNVIADDHPGSVLTSVVVKVDWTDDVTQGILGRWFPKRIRGEDTLTVKITHEGGKTNTHEETGSGSENLTYSINSIPQTEEVEAMNADEALQNFIGNHSDMNTADFNIEATVEIGEGFLKKNKDDGNKFSLYITYTYYYPEIENLE